MRGRPRARSVRSHRVMHRGLAGRRGRERGGRRRAACSTGHLRSASRVGTPRPLEARARAACRHARHPPPSLPRRMRTRRAEVRWPAAHCS
eukprot:3223532-Prymnesium_polylepis.1